MPRTIVFDSSPEAVFEKVRTAVDLAEVAWVEPIETDSGTRTPVAGTSLQQDPEAARVVTYRHGTEYQIEASLPDDTWLIVSNVDWRGWRAESDRVGELTVARANYAFLAIHVPEGDHEIRLWFRPRSFDLGLAVSLLGLVGFSVLLGMEWRSLLTNRGRRHSESGDRTAE